MVSNTTTSYSQQFPLPHQQINQISTYKYNTLRFFFVVPLHLGGHSQAIASKLENDPTSLRQRGVNPPATHLCNGISAAVHVCLRRLDTVEGRERVVDHLEVMKGVF